jgi:hypothetical protein
VELKAALKAIAASSDGGERGEGEAAPPGSKGDWLPNLTWLARHPADHPLRGRLLVKIKTTPHVRTRLRRLSPLEASVHLLVGGGGGGGARGDGGPGGGGG